MKRKPTALQIVDASLTIETLLKTEDLLDELRPVCSHLELALREIQATCEKARDIARAIIENGDHHE